MESAKLKDYFKVKINGLIADYDLSTLTNLYQPIVGYAAISIYLALKTKCDLNTLNELNSHEDLYLSLKMTQNDFHNSRKKLEAVGLLKTYREKVSNDYLYFYVLTAPKTPHLFFDDVLLFGTLIKILGEEKAFKLKESFKNKDVDLEGFEEITSSFKEVFKPNLNEYSYKAAASSEDKSLERGDAAPKLSFDRELLFKELKNISQIDINSISRKILQEIERIATLYGIEETKAASEISRLYQPNKLPSKHIDIDELTKSFRELSKHSTLVKKPSEPLVISSDTRLGKKVALMEEATPSQFLSFLQNNTNPTNADLRLIEDISKNCNLTNGVINVLIEYVLIKNHNILSRAYMERMASALVRENISNALDAMNYLNSLSKKKTEEKKEISKKIEKEDKEIKVKKPLKDESDDKDWDDIMKDLGYNDEKD